MAKRKKASSDISSSSNEDEDWQENGKSHAKSKPKQRVKKVPKEEEEEKEEGEVEDEDEDEDSEGFNDGYDENLIGDEEDQMRLANMNEKEREMELFARSEKREVLKTRYEIERKLRMAKKKEMMQSQTKMRSNERRRNMEEKRKVKNAIKGLKEQREKRKQKQRLRAIDIYSSSSSSDGDDDDEKPIKKKSSSSSSSSSSSDESDDDKGRRRSDKDDEDGDGGEDDSDEEVKEKEEDFILTMDELAKIKLSRYRLKDWCHAPFFKDTVSGCFVKVFIGYRERTDERVPIYKICQIVNVQEGAKTYKLDNTFTNKVASVKHANDTKNFRFEVISDKPFTQAEFDEWKYRMERDKQELPSKEFILKKQTDIQNAINYSYKDSDIEAIVKEKEKYKSMPVNFAVKKTELLKQKEMAEQLGNLDEVEKISNEIEDLESKAKELDLKRTQNISAISYINERNRMRNIIEAEKAIMQEREKEKELGDDPFRRRKCAPMLVHKFGRGANTSSSTPGGNSTEQSSSLDSLIPKPGLTLLNDGIKMEKDLTNPGGGGGGSPNTQADALNNDLFSAHNFDIQIDFDISGTMNMSSTSNASSSSTYSSLYPSHSLTSSSSRPSAPNRRSLNLEEYKKKKGLI